MRSARLSFVYILLNIHSEIIIRKALDKWDDGFNCNGKLTNNLHYADDMVLMATTTDHLPILVSRMCDVAAEFDLKLNVKKSEVMSFGRSFTPINDHYNAERVKKVEILYLVHYSAMTATACQIKNNIDK